MKNLFTSAIFSVSVILSSYAQNPQLWGLTSSGGTSGAGAIIKINGDGSGFVRPYSFPMENPGSYATGAMIQASNGLLYGLTGGGGIYDAGVIFSYDPNTGAYTDLFDFNDSTTGGNPEGSLVQDSNGILYGMTPYGGATHYGVLFSYNPVTAAYTKLFDFNDTTGPGEGNLVPASNGILYGVTDGGGAYNSAIFSYNPGTAAFTDLFDFNYNMGAYPTGSMVEASNGLLYGMTGADGFNNSGGIFRYNPNTATYTHFFDLNDSTGDYPLHGLIQDSNGLLYGTTNRGGTNDDGVIFSYNINTETYTKLFDFDTSTGEPIDNLLPAPNGLLYGMTFGSFIFSYNLNTSTYTKLFDFGSTFADDDLGGLMLDSNGLLYGTTLFGGVSNNGFIFSFYPGASAYTELADFNYAPNGATPAGSLLQAGNGLLYGVTTSGGAGGGNGVIFSFNPGNNTCTNLFNFNDTSGASPVGSLIQASNGLLYGMTAYGGAKGDGVIFSFNTNTNTYADVFDFSIISAYPYGSLIQDSNGLLYGAAYYRGGFPGGGYTLCGGVIFSYNLNTSTYTTLFDFNDTLGGNPNGSFTEAGNGLLYGMTSCGGAIGGGVIFSYNPGTSTYTDILDLAGSTPNGGPILAGNGLMYGMTEFGGSYNAGTIFSYNLNTATYTGLFDLTGIGGAYPYASLIQASNGLLYGMAYSGGVYNEGVIFSYDINTSTYSKLADLSLTSGANPTGNLIEVANPLGIKPINAAYDIKLYPNPTSDELFVQSDLFANNEIVFKLYDITGKMQSVNYVQQASQLEINTGNLAAGMYWLKININGEAVSRKFVKN